MLNISDTAESIGFRTRGVLTPYNLDRFFKRI